MAEQNLLPNQELEPEIDPNKDEYIRMKELEREFEFLELKEWFLKKDIQELKKVLLRTQEEFKQFTSTPLVIAEFVKLVDENHCIVESDGWTFYLRLLGTIIDRELLTPSAFVCVQTFPDAVVEVLSMDSISGVSPLSHEKKPDITYNDIAGCEIQKREIREAVELPLTHQELYRQIGIDPPNGVLLSGPPGTGKTMLAKAVAHHTTATFIPLVGSEFVTMHLGEGPRMVRDVFRMARENAPAIIFIDEVDAIATVRSDATHVGDREVQRCLNELLTQMDGFDECVNIKVIMATNRADTLDPALVRPGRIDHVIEFPLPDTQEKRLIFQTCTAKMSLSNEVDLEDYVSRPDKISPAEIASICQEAGKLAIRENRYVILARDFEKAYRCIVKRPNNNFEFYN